jgi:hypothetical protein
MTKLKRRCKKLTPEQKKAVWAEPESNAGAGWEPKGNSTVPPKYIPNRKRDTEPRLDEIFKEK